MPLSAQNLLELYEALVMAEVELDALQARNAKIAPHEERLDTRHALVSVDDAEKQIRNARDNRTAHDACRNAQANAIAGPAVVPCAMGGLRELRAALHNLKLAAENGVAGVGALEAALAEARSAGAAPRDLARYEEVLAGLRCLPFEIHVCTAADEFVIEVQHDQLLAALKQRISERMNATAARLILVLGKDRLDQDGRTIGQCGISASACHLIVAVTHDEVDDIVGTAASLPDDVLRGGHTYDFLKHMKQSKDQEWSNKLIRTAVHRRLLSLNAAAVLKRDLDDDAISHSSARAAVRQAAEETAQRRGSASLVDLADIDAQFQKKLTSMAKNVETFAYARDQARRNSEQQALDARSWVSHKRLRGGYIR